MPRMSNRFPEIAAVMLVVLISCHTSPDTRIQTAKEYLHNSKFELAEAELGPLIESEKDMPDSLLLMYGETMFYRGKLEKAKKAFLGVRQNSDYLTDLLGLTYLHLGNPDSARYYARLLLKSDAWAKSRGYHLLGRIGFTEGLYDSAYIHLNKSYTFALESGHPVATGDALRQLGVIDWYQGRLEKARYRYQESIQWYEQEEFTYGAATSISNIGLLYWQAKEYGKYIGYQLEAFQMQQEMGDLRGIADSYYFLSRVPFNDYNHPAFTFDYLEKSLAISKSIGYKWGEEVARQALLVYNIDLAKRMGMNPVIDSGYFETAAAAEIRLQQEYRRLMLLGDGDGNPDSLINGFTSLAVRAEQLELSNVRAVIYSRLFDLGMKYERMEVTEQALADMYQLNDEVEMGIFELSVPLKEIIYKSAKEDTDDDQRKLLAIADQIDQYFLEQFANNPLISRELIVGNAQVLRASTYTQIKNLAIRKRDPAMFFYYLQRENALPFFQTADPDDPVAHSIEQIVYQMQELDADPEGYKMQEFYNMIANLYQVQASKTTIGNYTPETSYNLRENITLEDFQKELEPGEAFLLYHISEEMACALLVSADSASFHELNFTEKDLNQVAGFFRDALLRGHEYPDDQSWVKPAKKLYKMLIEPLAVSSSPEGITSLLISPVGNLQKIPFSALVVSGDNQQKVLLAEQWATTRVSDISSFFESREKGAKPVEKILALAPESANLPGTKKELKNIERLAGTKARVYYDREAASSRFTEEFESNDLIHFAGHAKVVQGYPMYSYLQFNDRRLPIYKLGNLEADMRLVVLSACETGLGSGLSVSSSTGFDYTGFVQHFHKIGVHSILSTLWPVDDNETTQWMDEFYTAMFSGEQVRGQLASSVNRAHRAFIAKNKHPFYWAGFTLSGDSE